MRMITAVLLLWLTLRILPALIVGALALYVMGDVLWAFLVRFVQSFGA